MQPCPPTLPTLKENTDALPKLVPLATVRAILAEMLGVYTRVSDAYFACSAKQQRLSDWIGKDK